MKNKLTTRDKIKVARFAIGVVSLVISYVCLLLLPVTTIAALGHASGAAMSAGASGSTSSPAKILMLPFVIGLITWLFALVGGPGLVIRLLCLPSSIGYIAAIIFLVKVA